MKNQECIICGDEAADAVDEHREADQPAEY